MPRPLATATRKALTDERLSLALLVSVQLPDSDSHLTDYATDLTDTTVAPPLLYSAGNSLSAVGNFRESIDPRANATTLTFTATPEITAAALTTATRWQVTVRLAVIVNGQIAGEPVTVFAGRGSGITLDSKPDRPTVTLTVASHWAAFDTLNGRHSNSESQQLHFPGDRVFETSFRRGIEWASAVSLDTADPAVQPLQVIYGTRKVDARAVYLGVGGFENRHLYMAFALCEGPIEAVHQLWINDIPLQTFNRWSQFEGHGGPWQSGNDPDVWVVARAYEGEDDQTADDWFVANAPGWTSAHRGSGVAMLLMRFTYESEVFNGIPRVSALVAGRKIRSVRNLSATPAYSENPADQLYDYLTNTRFGRGLDPAQAQKLLASFQQAAATFDHAQLTHEAIDLGVPYSVTARGPDQQLRFHRATTPTWHVGPGTRLTTPDGSRQAKVVSVVSITAEVAAAEREALADETGRAVWHHLPEAEAYVEITVTPAPLPDGTRSAAWQRGDRAHLWASVRYESNVVLDTGKSLLTNIKTLLSGCRGMLPWIAGHYTLAVEGERPASFALDDAILTGTIAVKTPSRRRAKNRLTATFANPNTDWENDEAAFPAADQSTLYQGFVASDGEPLHGRLALPTVTAKAIALDLARIALYKSRGLIEATVTTTFAALPAAAGDVVTLSHRLMHWRDKPFLVKQLEIDRRRARLKFTLIEHDAAIYTRQSLSDADLARNNISLLPGPLAVPPPTDLQFTETFRFSPQGNIRVDVTASWTPPETGTVAQYDVQFRRAATANTPADDWHSRLTTEPRLSDTATPGTAYDVRIRALNARGASSAWLTASHTVTTPQTQVAYQATGGQRPAPPPPQNPFRRSRWQRTPPTLTREHWLLWRTQRYRSTVHQGEPGSYRGPWQALELIDILGGTRIRHGDEPPTEDTGIDGDLYVQASGEVWTRLGEEWLLLADLTPAAGNRILHGAVIEDTLPQQQGTRAGDVFVADDGRFWTWQGDPPVWVYQGDLTGPPGERGEKGDKGDKGEQGIAGINGRDGSPVYVWLAFADSPDGRRNFTTGAGGARQYMGVATNKTTPRESNRPADYTWTKVLGPQGLPGGDGLPGRDGQDGQPKYLWVAYANSPDGRQNFTTGKPGKRRYIGVAANQDTATESRDPADYNWIKIQGDKGNPGDRGRDGQDGRPGTDGRAWEYIYATSPSDRLGRPQYPANTWGYDQPGTTGGLRWHDSQPAIPAGHYLWRAVRRISGSPTTGAAIANPWRAPRLFSHHAVDGVSASVDSAAVWLGSEEGWTPAALTQDVCVRYYRGGEEFAQGCVRFYRSGKVITRVEILGADQQESRDFRAVVTGQGTAIVTVLVRHLASRLEITARAYVSGVPGESVTGTPQITSTLESIYRRSATKPLTPANTSAIPTGWTQDPPSPSATEAVWASMRSITQRGNRITKGDWSEPGIHQPITDQHTRTHLQKIYRLASKPPDRPVSRPDRRPSYWQADRPPPDATRSVWESTREVTFSGDIAVSATPWSKPARLTTPNRTMRTETIWRRQNMKRYRGRPNTASSAPDAVPDDWQRTRPLPTQSHAVFASTRTLTLIAGLPVDATPWSLAVKVATPLPGILAIDTIYLRSVNQPATPSSARQVTPPGWQRRQPDPTATQAVWCSERSVTLINGIPHRASPWGTPVMVDAPTGPAPPPTQAAQTGPPGYLPAHSG